MKKALLLSHGLHKPFNTGESVTSRNLAIVLSKIYDKVFVISSRDRERSFFVPWDSTQENVRIYYNEKEKSIRRLATTLERKGSFHIHSVNFSMRNSAPLHGKKFYYQLTYGITYRREIHPSPLTKLKTYASLLLNGLLGENILTPSWAGYKKSSKIFPTSKYHYFPLPLKIPSLEVKKSNSPLRMLYLGHATYYRFPYIEILKSLRKLKSKLDIILDIYFTFGPHTKPIAKSFAGKVNEIANLLDINEDVHVNLKNLSENRKLEILSRSDIFLSLCREGAGVDPPVSVMEAMRAGTCVIALPTWSLPFILSKKRGVVIPGHSIKKELTNSILDLVSSNKISEIGKNARNYIKKHHSVDSVAKRLEDIIITRTKKNVGERRFT